ncbi:alpha/beta fold hydrolase [Ruegeria conchae]|uniref:alpha/beta fold hydrolase n=1 Tax=Ruegeria conchae TaxID=981384 RepID=UPI0021A949F5|nr:alpha/beta fold hydrolase [Ruegeria conchae]UWR03764.1 alpha/beta fold hydrolase [Ruegeria conchae]
MKGTTRRTVLAGATVMLSAPFYLSSAKASVSKKHVVLVHGAWHGAWAWQETIPLLTKRGLSVSALDLSGMGTTAHLQSLGQEVAVPIGPTLQAALDAAPKHDAVTILGSSNRKP